MTKIGLDKLKLNNSTSIRRVMSMIKRSTCNEDKLYLKEVNQILMEKGHVRNSEHDIKRVKGFPKRITVFMFSKKTSLEFEWSCVNQQHCLPHRIIKET